MASTTTQARAPGSVFTPTWWTQVFRFAILGGLVFWIIVAFWPRGTEADLDHLLSDLRGRDVAQLQIDREEGFGGLFVGPWEDRSDDTRVRWRTAPDGDWHTFVTEAQPEYVAPPDLGRSSTAEDTIVFRNGRDPVLNIVAAELARLPDHGDSLRDPDSGWRVDSGPDLGDIWLIGTWLVVLAMLVNGPQPRWATKWAWFWLLNLQFGIGFVLLLLLDAPWARFASNQPEPLPHDQQVKLPEGDRRISGGWAFLLVAVLDGFG